MFRLAFSKSEFKHIIDIKVIFGFIWVIYKTLKCSLFKFFFTFILIHMVPHKFFKSKKNV